MLAVKYELVLNKMEMDFMLQRVDLSSRAWPVMLNCCYRQVLTTDGGTWHGRCGSIAMGTRVKAARA